MELNLKDYTSTDMRLQKLIFVFVTIFFMSGCASCGRSRSALKVETITNVQNTFNGKTANITIGMTKEQLKATWGEPEPQRYGEDIWTYSTDMNKSEYEKSQQKTATLYWIFFENGKIKKIEQNDLGEYKFQCSTVDL